MSRRLLDPMPERIVATQRAASNPHDSVWVTANAGSGKTYVLTARVLRLLLGGARPEEILCLTYTKAAAAEMRERVSARLGQWALLDDAKLAADLIALEGAPPTAGMLLRARSLFAHALDTPGGLKIQTIHAFCESVLHRFPKEAGVPFDFAVLEDFERDGMLQEARERVLSAGIRGSGETRAVETLFGLLSDFSIETAIVEALGKQRTLRRVLLHVEEAKRNLEALVPAKSRDAVLQEITDDYLPSAADHQAVFALRPPDPDGDDFIDRLARIDPAHPDADAVFEAYLTQQMTARKSLIKKSIATLIPDAAQRLGDEAARLERLAIELTRAELIERSEAMLDVVRAVVEDYERQKRARSLLDFDDLVEKLATLLADQDQGLWVRYKLDSGISHILVDEGQDTNPQQWDVISALIAEFFVGDSAAVRPRTLFVVGDQKQSIFSFQGADPEVFVDLGRQVYYTAKSVQLAVKPLKLHFSFRTLAQVLAAVDKVFAQPEQQAGVLETDFVHDTARAEAGGRVTLWQPTKDVEDEGDTENWATAPPPIQIQSAARRNAERIAREIKGWITTGRPLGPRRRPVTADDVLILVQVRSVLFHEIIRALIREGVPTPGADRLAVTTHIGTLDLMALGDVLSNPADDLQLAALLRSPLFDVSEDELFALAAKRPKDTGLWSALKLSTIPSVRAAYVQLTEWRDRLDFERPFNFYSDVLYAAGGLRRFRQRLGSEIDDVAAEFLDLALAHEQSAQPSLLGFLADLRSRDVTIKRELAGAGAGVRVMTVHGAKGLEAPIVILADAATTEEGRDRRSIYMTANPPLFFHAAGKATHAAETMAQKNEADQAQKAEYWRKLYVAMTRAEDELYVTGSLTKARDGKDSWYEAIERALRPESQSVTNADATETLIYPREQADDLPADVAGEPPDATTSLILPDLPAHQLRRIVRPSSAADDVAPEQALESAAERVARDPESARREGIALHALLQHLSRLDRAIWPVVAAKALPALMPDSPGEWERVAAKALSILTRPELSHLFGPNSRPELPILAQGKRKGAPVTIAGRIDRLVVEPGHVLIVDYKSDARPPANEAASPAAYVQQLGLYALVAGQLFPRHTIQAAILWTSLESLMILPQDRLAESVAAFTIG